MSDVGPGPEALAAGTAPCDAHGAIDTSPPEQPTLDLQQLALWFAAQQHLQQLPPPNHPAGPASILGAASPFGSFGATGFRVAPDASFGGDGVGGLGRGGPGYGAGGVPFSRGFASPAGPPPAQRTVTFGGAPAGGDTLSNGAVLRQVLARLTALESSREPALVNGGGEGRTSPTPTLVSQAST